MRGRRLVAQASMPSERRMPVRVDHRLARHHQAIPKKAWNGIPAKVPASASLAGGAAGSMPMMAEEDQAT